jgi:Zn finger protein HypA/HybF involved in hydrogenase expression
MYKYELECSECEEFTYVLLEEDEMYPCICPLCGAEAESEPTELELE